MTPKDVTVVGAGLAGAMLCGFLGRRGHRVTAFESRPDLRTTDIDAGRSINLALAARGIAALDDLGLMGDVEPLLTPMRGRLIHDRDGSETLQPYGSRPDEVIYSVSRSDLNAVLLNAAEASGDVTIRFEQRCTGGDLGSLRFRDYRSETEYDHHPGTVFGADGANSRIRDLVLAASGGTVTIDPLDHGYKELTLPAAPDGRPLLDPNALHIWPRGGFMLIALANLDCSFTCTLFIATQGPDASLEALDSPEQVETFFGHHFPDFATLMPDLAAEYLGKPDGALATVRCTGWSAGDRAVILGDAAHAIVPFHGQGMNAAFESCTVLMDAMDRHPEDWGTAFAEFEAVRKADVDAIADMALENYIEMRDSVRDERYVLKRRLALELERRWPDRFVPRYSLVMFRTIPYAEAQRRAQRQAAVLDRLTAGVDRVEDIDFDLAARLVADLHPEEVAR